jgi:DNA-binding XRE family transcriptional regulator
VERSVVSETVAKLRHVFGESQPVFAKRLGIALVTLARWETSRTPPKTALLKLEALAQGKHMKEFAEVFRGARAGEYVQKPTKEMHYAPPNTPEEKLYVAALLRVLRRPTGIANHPATQRERSQLDNALATAIREVQNITLSVDLGADVRKAIVSLIVEQGKSQQEVAELFSLDPNDVGQVLMLHIARQPGISAMVDRVKSLKLDDPKRSS